MPTDDDRPPEPPEPEEPFRVLDRRFWLALGFAVLCLIAAVAVVLFGPRLWPKPAPRPAPAAVSPAPPAAAPAHRRTRIARTPREPASPLRHPALETASLRVPAEPASGPP